MKIAIEKEKRRFNKHLSIEDNNKIIFSGIFGIGKTFFLKEFFENNDDYAEIYLSPVNYSIAKNEDILNFIKYDITFELLSKNIEFDTEEFPLDLTNQLYFKENVTQLFSKLLNHTGKIGKNISGIINEVINLKEEIEKYNENFKVDEKKEIISFLESIKEEKGSIYEENNITLLISSLIDQLENPVLILDDLDRLDPEHIFRILNIFSSHLDNNNTYGNKFGFKKIILVCDIENIRKIFNSRYGFNVDFNGYIDKFYSKEVFYLLNKNQIKESLPEILDTIKSVKKSDSIFDNNSYERILLIKILVEFINSDILNLRSLLKVKNINFNRDFDEFIIGKSYAEYGRVSNFAMIQIFDFLTIMFGNKGNLKEALNNLKKSSKSIYLEDLKYEFSPIIYFLDYDKHKQMSGSFTYENKKLDMKVEYELNSRFRESYISDIKYFNYERNTEIEFIPFINLLFIAFDKYDKIEYNEI